MHPGGLLAGCILAAFWLAATPHAACTPGVVPGTPTVVEARALTVAYACFSDVLLYVILSNKCPLVITIAGQGYASGAQCALQYIGARRSTDRCGAFQEAAMLCLCSLLVPSSPGAPCLHGREAACLCDPSQAQLAAHNDPTGVAREATAGSNTVLLVWDLEAPQVKRWVAAGARGKHFNKTSAAERGGAGELVGWLSCWVPPARCSLPVDQPARRPPTTTAAHLSALMSFILAAARHPDSGQVHDHQRPQGAHGDQLRRAGHSSEPVEPLQSNRLWQD